MDCVIYKAALTSRIARIGKNLHQKLGWDLYGGNVVQISSMKSKNIFFFRVGLFLWSFSRNRVLSLKKKLLCFCWELEILYVACQKSTMNSGLCGQQMLPKWNCLNCCSYNCMVRILFCICFIVCLWFRFEGLIQQWTWKLTLEMITCICR